MLATMASAVRTIRPHRARRFAGRGGSTGTHVVAIASMMSTLVARRAGMIAATTPTKKETTTRMTIVLNTGTVNTVTPLVAQRQHQQVAAEQAEHHPQDGTEHAGDHALPPNGRPHLTAGHADGTEQPDLVAVVRRPTAAT